MSTIKIPDSLPWHVRRYIDIVDTRGGYVACSASEDASVPPYIVHAANLYPELVKALDDVLGLIDSGWLVRDTVRDSDDGWALRQIEPVRKLAAASAALKQAKGE